MPFFPGDGAIDLAWQSVFLTALKTQEDIPVTVNDHDVLCPEKSILYVFGAGRQVEPCDIRHDCRRCPRETCYFRKE
jgi:hypothetical protein